VGEDAKIIEIQAVKKAYGNAKATERTVVLDGFDLTVRQGEFLTFFGPNGCGKSTILHILAGTVPYDSGHVSIAGEKPGEAKVGFVFQNFQSTLFPWKRNLDNVAWPLELQRIGRTERRSRAREFLKQMDISLPERDYPYQLSGGQQQLLSITRALIAEPKVLLMDEPFNQLDYQTRMKIQMETLELWSRTGTTVLFVSHDIEEALLLGSRTVLLTQRPARVREILENPLPRPRNHDMLKDPRFFELKSRALEIFSEGLGQ